MLTRSLRILSLFWLALVVAACGGGSGDNPPPANSNIPPAPGPGPGQNDTTPPAPGGGDNGSPSQPPPGTGNNPGTDPAPGTGNKPKPGDQPNVLDRDSFAQTTHPLLVAHCGSCHGDTAAATVSRFASADVSVAYTATKSGAFVSLSTPSQSVFVTRLAPGNHFCWTNCDDDAQTMTIAIAKWAKLAAGDQTPLNANPTAAPDEATTATNTAVTTNNVLANDVDPENEPLTITRFDSASLKGATVQHNNDGTFTYTPATGFNGQDTFSYTVSDPQGGSAVGTVTIIVSNPPVTVADSFRSFIDNGIVTGDVLKNDFDPAGTPLIITEYDSRSTEGGVVTAESVRGRFAYRPPLSFSGTDNFSYTVANGAGLTSTATVFISVGPTVQRDADRFLAFLNTTAPQHQEDAGTAAAYYATVDPDNTRTTLGAWRKTVGFDVSADAAATYVNNVDLGFSRRMYIRTDSVSGRIASYVENYPTLDDAINETNLIATVAMEYSPAAGQVPGPDAHWLTTFYVFGPTGSRELGADLDGRGFKYVPGLCNVCHGGEPQPLLADGTYPNDGDTGAGFLSWDLDTYLYSTAPDLTRAAQEDQFKIFNATVLKTRPTSAQRELIEGWYGGADLPNPTFDGTFVPTGWRTPTAPRGAEALYLQAIAPNCRACHVMRGRVEQNDIDFATFAKFIGYSDRIQQLVFDQATMPLALRTYERFWNDSDAISLMAQHLPDFSRGLSKGGTLSPGRPIADAGPSYETSLGQVDLSGKASLFSTGPQAFSWELLSRPAGSRAALVNTGAATTFFDADVVGDYVVHLIVNDGVNGTPSSAPAEVLIQAQAIPSRALFSRDVTPLLAPCATCHKGGGLVDFTTSESRYDNVRRYVNTDAVATSLILTKPSGAHHFGGTVPGFEDPRGSARTTVLRWILAGAQND